MKIAVCDTETTGFCEPEHRLVEIYYDMMELRPGGFDMLGSRHELIDPKRSIPAEAIRVHNITPSMVMGKPDWEALAPTISAELNSMDLIVFHNAEFDMNFINMELRRIGLDILRAPSFCTMENGIWASPIGKKPSLKELCFAMGVEYDPAKAHAADYDVGCTRDCFLRGVEWNWFNPELPQAA